MATTNFLAVLSLTVTAVLIHPKALSTANFQLKSIAPATLEHLEQAAMPAIRSAKVPSHLLRL